MAEMKLSEAIRAGSKTGPQTFGDYFDSKDGSCAYGAAAIGLNDSVRPKYGHVCMIVEGHCPDTNHASANCPACGEERDLSLGAMMIHLNDDHKWKRSQIADWLSEQGY